ncbi:hypothetical protein AGATL06_18320 [Agathobaculum sp. TL06]
MAGVMTMSVVVTVLNTLVLVAVLAGVIVLEVWLSRRKSRWPGLIMPALSLMLSLLLVLGGVVFTSIGGAASELQVVDEETGEVLYEERRVEQTSDWTLGDTVQVGIILLVSNIPTFVLLGVYYIGREKLRRERLLEKMNIQDL